MKVVITIILFTSLSIVLFMDFESYPYAICSMFEGTFGQVLECWDRETRELVAIKVVRSIKKYREAAMLEVDVLQLVGKYDKNGSR